MSVEALLMKYCPNPHCRHRMSVGSQAEYLDHVAKCADCGSSLIAEPGSFMQQSEVPKIEGVAIPGANAELSPQERNTRMDVLTGIFAILAGVGITVVTYAMALNGGVYLVAWGPLVFGIVRLMRGLEYI